MKIRCLHNAVAVYFYQTVHWSAFLGIIPEVIYATLHNFDGGVNHLVMYLQCFIN